MTKSKPAMSGLERERARRRAIARSRAADRGAAQDVASREPLPDPEVVPGPTRSGARRLGQQLACTWCGSLVQVKSRGPLPRFCSATCRHHGWEQERAARDGRVAVMAVDRIVLGYPADTQDWVAQLERLAHHVRRDVLDPMALRTALDLVHVALDDQERRHMIITP